MSNVKANTERPKYTWLGCVEHVIIKFCFCFQDVPGKNKRTKRQVRRTTTT